MLRIFVLILVLTGCATAYDTEKSFWTGNTGFSTQQLGEDLWKINFTGNNYTDRDKVESYVLKKSAQLAIEQGYSHFYVIESKTNKDLEGASGAGAFSGSIFGGQSYAQTTTEINSTVRLTNESEKEGVVVYSAEFLVNQDLQ